MKNKSKKKQAVSLPKQNTKIITQRFFDRSNLLIFAVVLITAIVYIKTLQFDFTNWDDDRYLNENPYIQKLDTKSIKAIFSESYFGNYHPITTLSYAIEKHFFGFNPRVFHFNNLWLHLINVLLVYVLFRKLSKRIEVPLITAFLFALHPFHVESVAWVSERKDVLYTAFFLASLIYYVKHLQNNNNLKHLIFCFILFLFSLLSKSAAVIMPVVMVLTAYYVNRKINIKMLLFTLPFFIMSFVFGLIAINTQVEAISNLNVLYPGLKRILLVSFAVYYYIIRFIFPVNMAALHAFPDSMASRLPTEYYIAPFILIAIAVLVFVSKKEFRQHFIFGLLFFLINVALIIQIIPVGQAIVAERYTYVPYIGLAFIVAQGFVFLKNRLPSYFTYIIFSAYPIFLIITTWNQVKVWKNSETLWTHTLNIYPKNQIAYNNRGLYRTEKNKLKEAYDDFNSLIEINPNYKDVYNNRATACFKLKDYECVVRDLSIAIISKPDDKKLYNNRGLARYNLEQYSEAISDFGKAIELDPLFFDAYSNRINAYEASNNLVSAISDLNFLIKENPSSNLYNMRGIMLGKIHYYADALKDFEKAILLEPSMKEAYVNKGIALLNLKNITEACNNWQKALNMGNESAKYWIDTYCK